MEGDSQGTNELCCHSCQLWHCLKWPGHPGVGASWSGKPPEVTLPRRGRASSDMVEHDEYTTGPAPAEEGPGYDVLPVFLGVALLAMARIFGHWCFMGRKDTGG